MAELPVAICGAPNLPVRRDAVLSTACGCAGGERDPANDEPPGQITFGRELREAEMGSAGNHPEWDAQQRLDLSQCMP